MICETLEKSGWLYVFKCLGLLFRVDNQGPLQGGDIFHIETQPPKWILPHTMQLVLHMSRHGVSLDLN